MKYKCVTDYDTALQKVEEVLNLAVEKQHIKYCKVDKIKLRNKYTKRQAIVKDLFFVATKEASCNPMFVSSVRIKDKVYILHRDLTHYNMSTAVGSFLVDSTHEIIYQDFCNTVKMAHLWKDPDTASKLLKGNLLEGNPNDSYRSINSVEADRQVYPLFDDYSSFMPNTSTLEQIITRRRNPSEEIGDSTKEAITKVHKALKEDKDMCYAYAANNEEGEKEYSYRLVKRQDIDNGKYDVSSYYRIYTAKDIDENISFSLIEKDICVIGLGSAGGGILEQLCKMNYIKSYTLIDFDSIEHKNLRNQPYQYSDIGNNKTNAIARYIEHYHAVDNMPNIQVKPTKYQDVELSIYKFKYLVSGFDNLECRIDVLNKIKSGDIHTEYLIDARYEGLDSSLFIVKTDNNEEMEYYEKLLLADKAELDRVESEREHVYTWTTDDVTASGWQRKCHSNCSAIRRELGYPDDPTGQYYNICDYIEHRRSGQREYYCGSEECVECIRKALEEQHIENTTNAGCMAKNIIHIYKMTSAWVMSAFRSIETDGKKYFTHVDITVDPIPNAVVLKK